MPVFPRFTARQFARLRPAGALALAAVVGLSAPSTSLAQQPAGGEPVQPDIENAKHQMDGVLLRPEFVRAGPGDGFYATTKLEKGARVTVVGSKNNWLKIVPPPGSYSYVQKVAIQRFGDGKQGKPTGNQVIVKAGSATLMWYPQCRLAANQTVEILADEEPYYRIKPPAGAYLYIAKESVEAQAPAAVAAAEPAAAPAQPLAAAPPPAVQPPAAVPSSADPAVPPPTAVPPIAPAPVAAAPATGPVALQPPPPRGDEPRVEAPPAAARPADVDPVPSAPSEKPLTAAEAVQRLQELEPQFTDASKKPLTDQPLPELTSAYEQVAATPGLNDVTRRWVENRLTTLKTRTDARNHLLATRQRQRAGDQRLVAQRAEGQEIQSAMRQNELQLFAVVGTLRTSSVQVSKTTLYRVADPASGRTLAYVWATDPKVPTLVDQFVGLRGPIQTHPKLNLRVVNPTAVEALDPAKLGVAYAADVIPPSLAPKAPTASAE